MDQNDIYNLLLEINNRLDEALNYYNFKTSPDATLSELKLIDENAQKATTLQKWARM